MSCIYSHVTHIILLIINFNKACIYLGKKETYCSSTTANICRNRVLILLWVQTRINRMFSTSVTPKIELYSGDPDSALWPHICSTSTYTHGQGSLHYVAFNVIRNLVLPFFELTLLSNIKKVRQTIAITHEGHYCTIYPTENDQDSFVYGGVQQQKPATDME